MDRIHKVIRPIRELDDSLEQINNFKDYMGGENSDQPMNQDAVEDMIKLAELCDKEGVAQPEFFPYYDASGAQAEWDGDHWYIEVDVNAQRRLFFAVKDRDYKNSVTCSCVDLNCAFQLAKVFLFYADNEGKESGLFRIDSNGESYGNLDKKSADEYKKWVESRKNERDKTNNN